MIWLYDLAVGAYHRAIHLASNWSPKAKAWVEGRRRSWPNPPEGKRVLWFHAASLGEYEQGRPVMENWKSKHPDDFLLLSFFSPSGFVVSHHDGPADEIVFLPKDTRQNARNWIRHWKPAVVVFFKYDFWLHHINETHDFGVPVGFISVLKPDFLQKPYADFFLRILRKVDFWTVQDEPTASLLRDAGLKNVVEAGDTRIDRVQNIRDTPFSHEVLANFRKDRFTLVMGSSWPPEEKMLAEVLPQFPSLKVIMAPHDVSEKHLSEIESRFPGETQRLSSVKPGEPIDFTVLIVDGIGMLSKIYRYGDVAFIGGGFGKSVHNTLEPAVYGLPVFFGPKHEKFLEPGRMIAMGFGHQIDHKDDFFAVLDHYNSKENRKVAKAASEQFFETYSGATCQNISIITKFIAG
ncbi:MAG: hypothetical protein JJU02_05670 [Cryomorphaceae bacterium]|nr:hypothetical protein [Cryomorphaceae bacterium]